MIIGTAQLGALTRSLNKGDEGGQVIFTVSTLIVINITITQVSQSFFADAIAIPYLTHKEVEMMMNYLDENDDDLQW